ncbi:MAG: glucosamine-6-phosphate deaminase [Firmicutes bacterium]|nr:glucosamine-6-phosphate deaminase [Bacillota bacterium]
MRVLWCADAQAAATAAAEIVARQVRLRPRSVLALPTGRSALPMYAHLSRLVRQGGLSLAEVTAFQLDEYVGLGPEDQSSFAAYVRRHLVAATDVDPARVHVPRGDAPDPEAEACGYERAIAAVGGIDLAVLGLGANGHIAFNEPGSPAHSRTRVVALTWATRAANAAWFGAAARVPERAITLGLATIASARAVVLIAAGANKAAPLARLLAGERGPDLPAAVLLDHPDALVAADRSLRPAAQGPEPALGNAG